MPLRIIPLSQRAAPPLSSDRLCAPVSFPSPFCRQNARLPKAKPGSQAKRPSAVRKNSITASRKGTFYVGTAPAAQTGSPHLQNARWRRSLTPSPPLTLSPRHDTLFVPSCLGVLVISSLTQLLRSRLTLAGPPASTKRSFLSVSIRERGYLSLFFSCNSNACGSSTTCFSSPSFVPDLRCPTHPPYRVPHQRLSAFICGYSNHVSIRLPPKAASLIASRSPERGA
jgi:hypothetical protein